MKLPKIPKPTVWKLHEILAEDDPVRLRGFFGGDEDESDDDGVPVEYEEVMTGCLEHGAKKCASYMLRGASHSYRRDLLHQAFQIPTCDPEVLELFLERFGGQEYANSPDFGGPPPIHIFLSKLSKIFPLCIWVPGSSLVKLLILLCDPQLRKKLHCLCACLLITHTPYPRLLLPFFLTVALLSWLPCFLSPIHLFSTL
ncbi:unnamed protein product [Cuscuta campestris]|uniref:Uncharacterized protein n=1 Tax=Cuscuta campestris TaxID=132261 RepID=A0A484N145_9ASTE|nr:unnamed protein product [Cuscuta campestris]